jgi:hypothetical protein
MQSRSPISRRVSLLLASLITIFATSIAHAQETSYKASFSQNKEAIAVNVLVGQSRVINFAGPGARQWKSFRSGQLHRMGADRRSVFGV